MEQMIERMGTAEEMANEFNESFSAEEIKKAKSAKLGKVIGAIATIVVILVLLFLILVPITMPFGHSGLFNEAQVNTSVEETIRLLNEEDYDSFLADANPKLVNAVRIEDLEAAKNTISDNWGDQVSVGTIYIVEVGTILQHFVTAQVSVEYENTMVTYTLTYDKDMKLSGLYMK